MHKLPPKLVIEMLPEEENLSLFERIKSSFQYVKRKSSDGSNSTSSEIEEDRRDSIRSSLSISSVDLSNRRASSASTFGELKLTTLTSQQHLTGNHGTFGPAAFSSSSSLMEAGRKEQCPLTRCLSAR